MEPQSKPIPPTGLTILVDPPEPTLDIVFVHGFTGHPEHTWAHHGDGREDTCEPPRKMQKLGSSSKVSTSKGVYWPRDLLPSTVKVARILTYGYDTRIRHVVQGPTSQNTVRAIAGNFLVALKSQRTKCSRRPIIFVVHSLGGIVLKEMLRRSTDISSNTDVRNVFLSTTGIVFFGTPHGGADLGWFIQKGVRAAAEAIGFSVNKDVVNNLVPSSEQLRVLKDDFNFIARHNDWMIHSFQEELGLTKLIGSKVVEDSSSYLGLHEVETTEHIRRNHMDMCRFFGHDDMEYRKVAAALLKMVERVVEAPANHDLFMPTNDQKQSLLDSLRFDQIDARHATIKKAHEKTCEWILKNSQYLDWLNKDKMQEHRGFLWLKGHPGTGKSTIMKYVLHQAHMSMPGSIVLSFFYNARGEHLEKSTTGLYRSLLLQLLEKAPELLDSLGSVGFTAAMTGATHKWNDEVLKDIFLQCIQILATKSVVCFIDALDECEDRQIRDMIIFFQNAAHGRQPSMEANLRIFFASRHYPHITMNKGLELTLEGQEGHDQDITNYLDSELKIGHGKMAKQIRGELQEKASGIFMWVIIVVEMLNKDFDNGRMHALQDRLRSIPGDLYELFKDILTRDAENRDELLLCIQWILFARQPLTPEQLYFAVLSGVVQQNALTSLHDDEDQTFKAARRFVLGSSKGLAQVTTSEVPTVQFIHESVRDFLLKEDGFKKIWPNAQGTLAGQSHDNLKRCCMTYLGVDITLGYSKPPDMMEYRLAVLKRFPFLEYALRNILHHANAAQANDVPQHAFFQQFSFQTWIKIQKVVDWHRLPRHQKEVNILYLLAEEDLSSLIDIYPEKRSYLSIRGGQYGFPLVAALVTESHNAIKSFIAAEAEYDAEQDSRKDVFNAILKEYSFSQDECIIYRVGYKMPNYEIEKPFFDQVFGYCGLSMLRFLYAIGAITPNCITLSFLTPLHIAAKTRSLEMAKVLLRGGPIASREAPRGRGPLPKCCSMGKTDCNDHAEVLLTGPCMFGTPLYLAVVANDFAMTSFVIETGCLHPQATISNEFRKRSLRLLLRRSLLGDTRNISLYKEGRNKSLLAAAAEINPAIFQFLLRSVVALGITSAQRLLDLGVDPKQLLDAGVDP